MLIELFILALVVTLVVLSMRPKAVALDQPLIVHSPGRYHITLAPQLAYAQEFLRCIADESDNVRPPDGDIPGQFFTVDSSDQSVPAGRQFLLAASCIGGQLYLQAITPQPLLRDSDSLLEQIRKFAEAVLALHPPGRSAGTAATEKLIGMVRSAAQQSGMSVKSLTEAS